MIETHDLLLNLRLLMMCFRSLCIQASQWRSWAKLYWNNWTISWAIMNNGFQPGFPARGPTVGRQTCSIVTRSLSVSGCLFELQELSATPPAEKPGKTLLDQLDHQLGNREQWFLARLPRQGTYSRLQQDADCRSLND